MHKNGLWVESIGDRWFPKMATDAEKFPGQNVISKPHLLIQ